MSFASQEFIAFFAVLFLLYYTIPHRHQWKLLLIGSAVFYCFAGWYCLLAIAVTTLSTWFAARKIGQMADAQETVLAANREIWDKETRKAFKANGKKKRWHLALGCMLLNFGILAVLKYTGFVLGIAGISFKGFAAVMGISFYTFQSMGYLIDVYWGKVHAEQNLARFALFVSFFPQLIQGPISRYSDLAESLYAEHPWNSRTVGIGAERVIWGFFKKMVIADRLAIPLKQLVGDPDTYTGIYTALVIVLYAAELYADFTGGIDITIGIANMLGIDVQENFIRPFFSKNTAEYWRRWHISMGSWFRDYVFYPLSTAKGMLNLHRRSKAHLGVIGKKVTAYLTMLILWFVTGIWHGASWNFIVWGMLNGVILLISGELEPLYARFHTRFPKLKGTRAYDAFQIIRTFSLMSLIRVFDVYRDVPLTFHQIGSVFTRLKAGRLSDAIRQSILTANAAGSTMQFLGLSAIEWILCLFGIVLLFTVSLLGRKREMRFRLAEKPVLAWTVSLAGVWLILLLGIYGIGFDSAAFIYNQF